MAEPPAFDRPSRRRVLGWLGASALGVVSRGAVHPLVPVQPGETWRPRFFDAEQLELVAELAERIVPETDTPGARGALVHQFIDWALSEADEESQEQFVAGLVWIEQECRRRHGEGYLAVAREERHRLLSGLADAAESSETGAAGNGTAAGQPLAFFRQLKARAIQGYYASEVGMREELGYRGNAYLRRFEGCAHPEHLAWHPGGDADPAGPGRER